MSLCYQNSRLFCSTRKRSLDHQIASKKISLNNKHNAVLKFNLKSSNFHWIFFFSCMYFDTVTENIIYFRFYEAVNLRCWENTMAGPITITKTTTNKKLDIFFKCSETAKQQTSTLDGESFIWWHYRIANWMLNHTFYDTTEWISYLSMNFFLAPSPSNHNLHRKHPSRCISTSHAMKVCEHTTIHCHIAIIVAVIVVAVTTSSFVNKITNEASVRHSPLFA